MSKKKVIEKFLTLLFIVMGIKESITQNITMVEPSLDCFPKCENGGYCDEQKCTCPVGFEGRSCELDMCQSRTVDIPSMNFTMLKTDNHKGLLSCSEGYKPKQLAAIDMECIEGIWKPSLEEILASDFRCEPHCEMPALNGGICIGPNVYFCKESFIGKACEFAIEDNCSELNFTIDNVDFITNEQGLRSLDSTKMEREFRCSSGYELAIEHRHDPKVYCIGGGWSLADGTALRNVRDSSKLCRPVCSTHCQNEGRCVSPDRCECPPNFHGQFCEIRICDVPKPEIDHIVYTKENLIQHAGCDAGYLLSNGYDRTSLHCTDDGWVFDQYEQSEIVSCIQVTNCPGAVPNVTNARVIDGYLGVKLVECIDGYMFPHGYSTSSLACILGKWRFRGIQDTRKGCIPRCARECQNGGFCVAPDQCVCPPHTSGQFCEDKLCSFIPLYGKAKYKIHSHPNLYIECSNGSSFITGEKTLNLTCTDGKYITQEQEDHFPQSSLPVLFECLPNCYKKCLNGGTCRPDGQCQCAPLFHGDFCQEELVCNNRVPTVRNSVQTKISPNEIIITCMHGYELPGHRQNLRVQCSAGGWRMDHFTVPDPNIDCEPICEDNCSGNGNCTSPGVCECLKGFSGSKCEDNVDIKCEIAPPLVQNSRMQYNLSDGHYECMSGYAMPNGETSKKLKCYKGHWQILDCDCNENHLPECLPQCKPDCQNGGTCVSPDVCSCPKEFVGRRCQNKKPKKCQHTIPPIPNSKVTINSDGSFVTCDDGYSFPHGSEQESILCRNGSWHLSSSDQRHLVACYPVCSVPCLNRGKCVAPETCHCVEPYTGPNCENLRVSLCWKNPPTFQFASIVYSPFQASVSCLPGYSFRSGETTLKMNCVEGRWILPYHLSSNPFCVPVCSKTCLNGGVCIRPDVCECLDNFEGADCGMLKPVLCVRPPRAISHSTIKFVNSTGFVQCEKGYRLSSGYSEVNIVCQNGVWVSTLNHQLPISELKCKPVCERPCANGGSCIGPNKCECQEKYAGNWCQLLKCKGEPKNIKNSEIEYSEDNMKGVSRCKLGYRLRWGSLGVTFECRNGRWEYLITETEWTDLECLPVCQKPCLNGAVCISPNVCQCPEGFFGNRCQKRYETTITGEKCKFPFRFKEQWYYGCTGDGYHRPWCATVTNAQNMITSWGVCVADLGAKKLTLTYEGSACVFPFTYRGSEYRDCTTIDRGRDWCATEVNAYNHIVTWGFCNKDWGSQSVILTVKGDECSIPFEWEQEQYTECVSHTSRPWCLLKASSSVTKKNGYCMADWGYAKVTMTKTGSICIFPFVHDLRTYDSCFSELPNGPKRCAIKIDEKQNGLVFDDCVDEDDFDDLEFTGRPQLSSRMSHISRHISDVATEGDLRCVFPFLYDGEEFTGCTSRDSKRPWCATRVDIDGQMVERDFCPPNWDIPDVNLFDLKKAEEIEFGQTDKSEVRIATVRGNRCSLPFVHEGVEHFGCVENGYKRPWCAVKIDPNGNVVRSEACPDNWDAKLCPKSEESSIEKYSSLDKDITSSMYTVTGERCLIPFVYLGQTHTGCTTRDSMRRWCPTSLDEHGTPTSWGYCATNNDQSTEEEANTVIPYTLCDIKRITQKETYTREIYFSNKTGF